MSPTGRPLVVTSYDPDDSRGDEFEDAAAEARGADSYVEKCGPRETRLGLLDDIHLDPEDQDVMQQQDQMQLILQQQGELAELKRQLTSRVRTAPSVSDTSMETAPPSPQ
ncbi:unnamed protein product [Phytophthora fragariaefolia]|uniref:Unnamed protein product n=1 Tax=Phytophthora fragariaefolia TaxID=1490495 RepID=A0A9W6YMH0_9STRA|nr:unnamed protein product [Phytophthora fragariaefolia]